MKQVIVMGDTFQWGHEMEFLTDMLHLAAARVITVNISDKPGRADLNMREVHRLFPGLTREQSVAAAIARLYIQGIADGLLCILGNEPQHCSAAEAAFAALPYGAPKLAVLSADCAWQSADDVACIRLPGRYNRLNPVIKICLGNAAFALRGMTLCSAASYCSSIPTVACCCPGLEPALTQLGVNYLSFPQIDRRLLGLLRQGYCQGLAAEDTLAGLDALLEIALAREIPTVLLCKNPADSSGPLAALINKPYVVTVSPQPSCLDAGNPAAAPLRYGSQAFYLYAAKTLQKLLN
ncbi:MAG: hypothetical protein GX090_05520 [Firmicutes bacterium]|nr:hypothetical protein [Bacillota bacterium]